MNKPIVSIIIPAYNVEKYLDKCLASVCAQTMQQIEVILINDGSTDSTPALCNKWAEKDSRVKVIHQSNQGLAETCNIGVKAAMGEFIGFVDSDDWVEPTMFEDLYQASEKHNSDIAVCNIIIETQEGKLLERMKHHKSTVYDNKTALINLMMDKSEKSYRWNKLYRKHLFDGVMFPKGRVFEDLYTMHKLYAAAKKVCYIPHYLYHYLQRFGSIIDKKSPQKEMDFFMANAEKYNFISSYPHFSDRERKMLQIRTMKRMLSSIHNVYKTTLENEYFDEKEEIKQIMRKLYRPDFSVKKHWLYLTHNYFSSIPFLFAYR